MPAFRRASEEEIALLPPGLHPIELDQLRNLCIRTDPGSRVRNRLMIQLESIVFSLKGSGVPAKVWVDGSFLTKKRNPRDIDPVVWIDWGVTPPEAWN